MAREEIRIVDQVGTQESTISRLDLGASQQETFPMEQRRQLIVSVTIQPLQGGGAGESGTWDQRLAAGRTTRERAARGRLECMGERHTVESDVGGSGAPEDGGPREAARSTKAGAVHCAGCDQAREWSSRSSPSATARKNL